VRHAILLRLQDSPSPNPSRKREGDKEEEKPMLEMRPDCERCGTDLPADEAGAFICSFECTFCAQCADRLDDRCPNCGGELMDRPARVDDLLARHPASTERRFKRPQ
jgi:uncharacterized protein